MQNRASHAPGLIRTACLLARFNFIDSVSVVAIFQCERLNRKRSSFVASFVSTHGRTIDDVDRSILDARSVSCQEPFHTNIFGKEHNVVWWLTTRIQSRSVGKRCLNKTLTIAYWIRSALIEVKQDLQERTTRWRQIETLCNVPIAINPGLNYLETLLRSSAMNSSRYVVLNSPCKSSSLLTLPQAFPQFIPNWLPKLIQKYWNKDINPLAVIMNQVIFS